MICNKCNNDLPESEFYKNKASKRGYMYSCKKCTSEHGKLKYRGVVKPKFRRCEAAITSQAIDTGHECKRRFPAVYLLSDSDGVCYVGSTGDIQSRISSHKTRSWFFGNVVSARYVELSSFADMAIIEISLINKLSPKYNQKVYPGEMSINIDVDLEWKDLSWI